MGYITRKEKPMLFVRDKIFYQNTFRLLLPIVFQNIMSLALQLSDTVMLGLLPSDSEVAISAANLANKPFFVYQLFIFGIVSGASVLISQYWGKGDRKTIANIFGFAACSAISLGTIATIFLAIFPDKVMGLFSQSDDVIQLGSAYLTIVLISYIPSAVISLLYGILKSTEQVKIPLFINGFSIILNIFLNYLLIFGKCGFPVLEVRGAAIATASSKLIEFILIILYIVFFETKLKLKFKNIFGFKKQIIKDFMHYSLPVIFNETLWGLGITLHAAILGNIGEEQYAAYSLANIIEQIALLGALGFANASAIIIGKELGSGRRDRAYGYAKTLLAMSTISGFTVASALVLFRHNIINIFSVSDTTKAYASTIIIVMFFMIAFKAFNIPCVVGVIRGGGDTLIAMLIDFIPMWFIAIPLGFIAAKVWKLPVYYVYAVLMCDEAAKIGFAIYRVKSKKWIKNITR